MAILEHLIVLAIQKSSRKVRWQDPEQDLVVDIIFIRKTKGKKEQAIVQYKMYIISERFKSFTD